MDIKFKEAEIKDELLPAFNSVCPGALDVFIVLCAYAPEKTKTAKVTIKTVALKTGFSVSKTAIILNKLKAKKFIDAPLEGRQGKVQSYKLKFT